MWARSARSPWIRAGRLAAATSTGGMTGKRYQRIGDSPIIGAGTYADDRACAVSATGHGEIFIRAAVAHDICARVRFGGEVSRKRCVKWCWKNCRVSRGEGGVIAIDPQGRHRHGIQFRGYVPRQQKVRRRAASRDLSSGMIRRQRCCLGSRPGLQPPRWPPRFSKRPVRRVWYSASMTTTRFLPCSFALYNASSAS